MLRRTFGTVLSVIGAIVAFPVRSFANSERAVIYIEVDGDRIGTLSGLTYETENNYTREEGKPFHPHTTWATDMNIDNEEIRLLFVKGDIHQRSQRVPVDFVIETDGKITGTMKNCWVNKFDGNKSHWSFEEYEPTVTFCY